MSYEEKKLDSYVIKILSICYKDCRKKTEMSVLLIYDIKVRYIKH